MELSQPSLRQIGEPLAESLALLEAHYSTLEPRAVHEAVAQTWERLVHDAVLGDADLSGAYLAALHRQLASVAGGEEPGVFVDRGQPLLASGQQTSWKAFVEEFSFEVPPESAWVLAQMRWGQHVRSLALPLGWLAMNIALMRNGEMPIVPPVADHARLLQYLSYAGPDLYDAESLRALIGIYAAEQGPKQ